VDPDDYLWISALQHYAYCPRQFSLIHVEQAWDENQWTAEGRLLHDRIDSGEAEQRGSIRYERGIQLISHAYRIRGKSDLIEIHTRSDGSLSYYLVEYKRGKPKIEDWDRIQLCAQALCIEEMRSVTVEEAALWYFEMKKRERVLLDDRLRAETKRMIHESIDLIRQAVTPKPTENKTRCTGCSLGDRCAPVTFRRDDSAKYVQFLFLEEDEAP
jgi:CRISPR-associated exonuclease Cas4